MGDETVLTTRRARCRVEGTGWVRGRLRLTDRRLVFTAFDGSSRIESMLTELGAVHGRRDPRVGIVVTTADGALHLRCFEASAVAALIEGAVARLASDQEREM